MNELLFEISDTMKRFDIVKTDNQFSIEWLGRSPRLYSWAKATGNPPAMDVLVGLYNRLDILRSKYEQTGEIDNAAIIDDLTDRLWDGIRSESLSRTYFRRKVRSSSVA